jgi:hypothetical protein
MKKLIHKFLKRTHVIIEYVGTKGEPLHKFNLYNPFGWVILILYATLAGVVEFIKAFYFSIKQTIKDSL